MKTLIQYTNLVDVRFDERWPQRREYTKEYIWPILQLLLFTDCNYLVTEVGLDWRKLVERFLRKLHAD